MTDATSPQTKPIASPDDLRMTVGDHLDELRRRLILALVGVGVVLMACLFFGDQVLLFFCRPLYHVLEAKSLNTQLRTDEAGEAFMVWLQVNFIVAAVIASPWIVYQLWAFVAAGLYPHERKTVTRYLPLSITLLVAGMAFVYLLVLPWTLEFFIDFGNSIPAPGKVITTTQPYAPVIIPQLHGDPVLPRENEMWIDDTSGRIKIFFQGTIRSIRFSTENLIATELKLSTYIDLVVGMLLTFGLSFQLPIVVMALGKAGIVEVKQLKEMRKYVYFALVIVSAAITPGDVLTATVALLFPLCALYELGIWLIGKPPVKRPMD